MKNKFIAGALAASIMLPTLALAQSDTQAQINALLSQIRALQEQLKTLIANSSSTTRQAIRGEFMPPGQFSKEKCIEFGRNLRLGAQGEDVKTLQEMLKEDKESGFSGIATGFFGPMTARAMAKWQMRMGIASSTDGSVGPMTRGFFARKCGLGLSNSGPGSINRANIKGEIAAVSTSTITVKGDGNRTVHISSTTDIRVFSSTTSAPTVGSMSDLTVGKQVVVSGTKNSDGSVNAVVIHVGIMKKLLLPALKEKLEKIMKFDNRGKKIWDDSDDEEEDDSDDDEDDEEEDDSDDDEDDEEEDDS